MRHGIAILAWFCIAAGAVRAQQPVTTQPTRPPESSYLNTSFEAVESLEKAGRLADTGDWHSAAVAFQQAADKYGDTLIAPEPRHYISLRQHVNERIARWPDEGLQAYRAAYDVAARSAFDRAAHRTGVQDLLQMAEQYFATSSAAAALDEAAERAIESGDFESARRWYERMAAHHPDKDRLSSDDTRGILTYAQTWRIKAALCAGWMSDARPLNQITNSLTDEMAAAQLRWGGFRSSLRDTLAEAIKAAQDNPEYQTIPAKPDMLAGANNRRNYFESTALAEARLWRFDNWGRSTWDDELAGYESQNARKDAWLRLMQSGRLLAQSPVAGGPNDEPSRPEGEPAFVYVHDTRTVWAIDPVRTDRPAWRFELPDLPAAHTNPSSDDDTPAQFTSLLAGDRLYVPLETEQPPTASSQGLTLSILVCLNAASGQLLWRNNLEGFASPFEDTRLDGAPILHRGKLFSIARRRKPFGFEACFLLCFDPDNGKLLWNSHLGEAATGSYGYHRATISHPAAAGDLVFVETNLGTIAAVSAETGRIAWLTQYDSRYTDPSEGFGTSRMGRPTRAWQYPTVVTWHDAVICMPLDGDKLMAINQFDGHELFQIDLEKLGNPEAIIGIRGDVIYLVGMQVQCFDLSTRGPVWQRSMDTGQPFGRGLVTNQGVFVPTERALLRYPLRGGPVAAYRWPIEDAGNLTALSDQIVVASATGLYSLAAKDEAFHVFEKRMARAPTDPDASLALAELAFNTDEYDRGMNAVEETVRRIGGFAHIEDDQTRARIFTYLQRFATGILDDVGPSATTRPDEKEQANRIQTAISLLKLAGQCAPDIASQISYRLYLGRAELTAGLHSAALATYQQILTDKSLRMSKTKFTRDLLPPGIRNFGGNAEDESLAETGSVVSQWIARLINEMGRPIYENIDAQAMDRFKVAQAKHEPAALLEVADAYPNSLSAPKALIAHARLTAQRGDLTSSLKSYRRVLIDAGAAERPALVHEYILCLARAGKWELARQWIRRASQIYPTQSFAYDDRSVRFSELERILLRDHDTTDTTSPRTVWPMKETFKRIYSEKTAILDPVFNKIAGTGWDSVITYSGTQLEARNPANGAALWSRPVACATQPQLLGMDTSRFIFASNHRIFALTRTSGQPLWNVGDEPGDDPAEDPESIASWTGHFMTAARLFSLTDRGDLYCIDVASGAVRWKKQNDNHVSNQLVADDRFVCFATWQGRQHTLQMLDAVTGEKVSQARPEEDWPVQSLSMSTNGDLAVLFSTAIHMIDCTTGNSRFRISTTDRFVPSSLCMDEEGLMVSSDGRHLTKYDAETGRPVWTSTPVNSGATDGLWVQLSDGTVFAACSDAFAAFDAADGRTLWTARTPSGSRPEAPRLTADSIITVTTLKSNDSDNKKAIAHGDSAKKYQLTRLSRKDGAILPLSADDSAMSESMTSFSGLFIRDEALILLDANRLLGYASEK